MAAISAQAGEQFVSTASRLRQSGIEEGLIEGMEKGVTKGTESVALSMLREGMDDSLVRKLTQITAEQLQKLKAQLDGGNCRS